MSSLWFSLPRPRILAHRGLALHSGENTLQAFHDAWDTGARYLETDVRLTADGIVVAAHDDLLTRATGIARKISETNFADLDELLDRDHQVPRLVDLLEAFPDAMWNIDVKSDDALSATAAVIHQAGLERRVLLANFDAHRAKELETLLPESARSLPAYKVAMVCAMLKLGLDRVAQQTLRGYDAVQAPVRHRHVNVLSPRVIAGLKRLGIEVHVWTVNDPTEMRRLLRLGVDGIFTDRVDIALKVAAEGY